MNLLKRLFGKSSSPSTSAPLPGSPTDWTTTFRAAGLDPKAKVLLVRAFLVALDPGLVIGIQHDDQWYLPGGIVEGPGKPEGVASETHFEPLAWHLANQTGLRLTGLSDAVGIGLFPAPGGTELTVLYLGTATGLQIGGTQFQPDSLPEFAKICAVSPDWIRTQCNRF